MGIGVGKLHMQRASGVGAWIMAGRLPIPIAEKPPFLALFVFNVPAPDGHLRQAGEISGFLASFVGYARQRMALVLRAFARLSDNKEPSMAVSGLTGIENMLEQMRAAVRAAQGNLDAGNVTSASAGGFAGELQRSLERVSNAQNASTAQAQAFELGDPNVSLNDVVIDMQKANIGFQTAVQVRNRLVSAYKDISSISV
jgi:flagellar hook-basal body complex protein FliE